MKTDSLKEYRGLRAALIREKEQVEKRLALINEALGGDAELNATKAGRDYGRTQRRVRNDMSLREAVRKVTAKKALTKEEILKAVGKLGYRFSSSDPIKSLNVVLYSNKQFKRSNGKFRVAR